MKGTARHTQEERSTEALHKSSASFAFQIILNVVNNSIDKVIKREYTIIIKQGLKQQNLRGFNNDYS